MSDGTAPRQKLNLSVFGCMEYGIFMIDKLHAPCDVRNIQLDMDEHGPMGHMIIFHRIHPHVPLDLILKRLCCASFKMQIITIPSPARVLYRLTMTKCLSHFLD